MSAAFNQMMKVSNATFVIQVDGDVVLEPWAVQKLVSGIRYKPWVYASWGQLWQDKWGLGGAVRCWRRNVVKHFGFRDVRCVDRDLHRRIRRWVFQRKEVKTGAVFGTHYPCETEFDRFSKIRNDVAKWIYLGRTDLISKLQLNIDGDELRRHAITSVIGMDINRSKNLNLDLKMYERLRNANRF